MILVKLVFWSFCFFSAKPKRAGAVPGVPFAPVSRPGERAPEFHPFICGGRPIPMLTAAVFLN